MRTWTKLVLVLLWSWACTDPTGPVDPNRNEGRTAKPRIPDQPNLATESPVPEIVNPQATAAQWCNSMINGQQFSWSVRGQRLVWDDPYGHANTWVAWGRFRIQFRGYTGTYGGQPIQCVRIENMYLDSQLLHPINGAHPRAEFYAYDQYGGYNQWFAWCWYDCATAPARLHTQVSKRWFWQIDHELAPPTTYQTITLGTIILCCGGNYNAGEWDVELYPNGYWTVYNYGGNGGSSFGYWAWAPTGYLLHDVYKYSSTPGFYEWLGGLTHWTLET